MNACGNKTVNECGDYFRIYICGKTFDTQRTNVCVHNYILSRKYPLSLKKSRNGPKSYIVRIGPPVFES